MTGRFSGRICARRGGAIGTAALAPSILELAKQTDTPAPSIRAVYACVELLNKVMPTEGGGLRLSKAAWATACP